MSVVTPDHRGRVVITVPRQDYTTCREPARGTSHCNALVALYQRCVACAVRKGKTR